MFKKGDLVRLVADESGHGRIGELVVVRNANYLVFTFQHGDEPICAYNSDAVLESSLNLAKMLRECLE